MLKMAENKNIEYIVRQMQVSDCDQVTKLWTMLDFLGAIYENQVILKVDPKGTFIAQDVNNGIKYFDIYVNISLFSIYLPRSNNRYLQRNQYIIPIWLLLDSMSSIPSIKDLGIGSALWRAVIKHIGPDRNAALFCIG